MVFLCRGDEFPEMGRGHDFHFFRKRYEKIIKVNGNQKFCSQLQGDIF